MRNREGREKITSARINFLGAAKGLRDFDRSFTLERVVRIVRASIKKPALQIAPTDFTMMQGEPGQAFTYPSFSERLTSTLEFFLIFLWDGELAMRLTLTKQLIRSKRKITID